ncbi:GNAT family N-acetyltransferase [Plantactinospora sp. DSM 117369]
MGDGHRRIPDERAVPRGAGPAAGAVHRPGRYRARRRGGRRDGAGRCRRQGAWGRLAPAGEFGIVDKVETEPAHRRRGLGSVLVRTLAARAAAGGLRTGILVATDDGRALYRTLGWVVRSDVPAAYRPEAHPG